MKKFKVLAAMLLLGAVALPLASCMTNNEGSNEIDQPTFVLPTEIDYLDEPGIQIHYQRGDNAYKDWGLWLWAEGLEGHEYAFNYQDDYGGIAYYPLSKFNNPKFLGFIVKQMFSFAGDGNWVKDGNYDRFMDIDMLDKDEHDIYHVWIKSKTKNVYTDEARQHIMNAVISCQFINAKEIEIKVNNPINAPVILKNGEPFTGYTFDEGASSSKSKILLLNEKASVNDMFQCEIEFKDGGKVTKPISIRNLYDYEFDIFNSYSGQLGPIYSHDKTEFKVWSPVSSDIKLRIYNNGTPKSVSEDKGDDTFKEYNMAKGEKGVFSATVEGDLEGKYYTYFVTNAYNLNGKEIVDPYAYGAGVNGLRGMIVDFEKTNPEGWEEVGYQQTPKKHLTVYETHVADLTSSETWTGTEANRKKFLGMCETGTTYTANGQTVSTGFDHIKELGVNAVQVIPFFDQANDETNMKFNWGYNPLNYNVVEGGYSSDPYDGYVRIRELKTVIQAYKEAGISFIMDVVYNHVNGLSGSNFDVLMPGYYFRYNDEGQASSGSGCGNDTASERTMFAKFMLDSTKFWTKEYKLDGFRFDLMGLHTTSVMNSISSNLKSINPNITLYGEAWVMGTSLAFGFNDSLLANQRQIEGMNDIAQFNDKGRDALVPGGFSQDSSTGWGNSVDTPAFHLALGAMIKGETFDVTKDPDKTVNYATCHDGYTIGDRSIAAGLYDEVENKKTNLLANSIVMTSQGISFMLSGEEMLRTKVEYDEAGKPIVNDKPTKPAPNGETIYKVSKNSYSSSYKTNEINWEWKIKHMDLFENYKKIIWLKQHVKDLGLNLEELKASKTFTSESLRNATIFKTTFNSDEHAYTCYFGAACLYNEKVDSAEPFVIDLKGQEQYLISDHNNIQGDSIELKPREVVIVRKAL